MVGADGGRRPHGTDSLDEVLPPDTRRPGRTSVEAEGWREADTSPHRHGQLAAGLALLALTALGGLALARGSGPSIVDRWVPSFGGFLRNPALTDVTVLRYPQAIVVGALLVALLVLPRDPVRALACAIGPPLALLTCESVIKPLVGRTLGSGLSYPSGSTVGAAALMTAVVLATPSRWRPVAIGMGAAYVLWMSEAVIALQWHYPTDALAGIAYGTGVMLLVDVAVSTLGGMVRTRAGRRSTPSPGG